jgi:putative transposase
MILTYKIKHGRDFTRELSLAKKIADFSLTTKSWSSAQVKHIGLKSVIACQILRKYSRNKTIKSVKSVKLPIPSQGIKLIDGKIWIPCLKLSLEIWFPQPFQKINQIEIGEEFAHISVSYPNIPPKKVSEIIGIDRNTTHHSIVASCINSGKVLKLGKSCNHIHQKYRNMRKDLQKNGKYRKVKEIKNREQRIVRDTNHKITTTLIRYARDNDAALVLEDLKLIRRTAKTGRRQRYSLNSWSFYQQQMMIEYKAKKFGVEVHFVEPQYTSQRCSICGHIEQANRVKNLFSCKKCGTVEDSGVNAGFNIAFLQQQGIPRFSKERVLLEGNTDTPEEATP